MAQLRRSNHAGHITPLGPNRFRAQIQIDGKRFSHNTKTKQAAQQWLDQRRSEIVQHYDYSQGLISLADYLTHWIRNKRQEVKTNTSTQYQALIDTKILPKLGDRRLNELRRKDIDDFYLALLEEGVGKPTIRYTHRVLRAALEDAVRDELLLKNPAGNVRPPRYDPPEMQLLEEHQVSLFLQAAQDSRFAAIYHLAITTGLRQSELLGLQWTDIKWQARTIHIVRQVTRVSGQGYVTFTPKTNTGKRVVKVGDVSLDMLRRHYARQQEERAFAGNQWEDRGLVFASMRGTPLDRSNLRKDFHTILESTGLPKIRFHDLRHTAASIMLNRGIPILSVSRMLGHSKPSVTLDIYGHLMVGMLDSVADLMDDLVTPVPVEIRRSEPVPRYAKGDNLLTFEGG